MRAIKELLIPWAGVPLEKKNQKRGDPRWGQDDQRQGEDEKVAHASAEREPDFYGDAPEDQGDPEGPVPP